jgi:hypothetical protein
MFWNTAFACTCWGDSTVKKAVKNSDFVFTGKVISAERVSLLPKDYIVSSLLSEEENKSIVKFKEILYARMKYVFEISAIYKGKVTVNTLVVYSGFGDGDCGYEFRIGHDYIVYAKWNKSLKEADLLTPLKFLETNICTRTRLFDDNEVAEIRKYSRTRN